MTDAVALAAPDLDRQLDLGREDLQSAELALDRYRLSHSLYDFMGEFWSCIEPGPFVPNWHIQVMCADLEAAYEQWRWSKIPVREIWNIPPGTMKSLTFVFFNAWAWTKDGRMRFLTFSYGQHLTTRDNLNVKKIVQSDRYQELWPLGFAEDQDTKTRYNTDKGGWRVASSVGGVGTGEHPDVIVIDDAMTFLQAMSKTERDGVNSWFDGTVTTRGVGRNAMVFCVGQRLHADDLPAHLQKKGGWVLLRLPMRYEKCTCTPDQRCALHLEDASWAPDPRDPRTEAGELLFPGLFDEDKVKKLETDLDMQAPGQLQQRPSREGGTLFRREWFKFVDTLPAERLSSRGWDTAATEGGGDYTAGAKISEVLERRGDPTHPKLPPALTRAGRFIVESVVRDQLGPDDVDKLMLSTAQLDGVECAVREQREGGASGKAVISDRQRLLNGFDYDEVHVGVNKPLFSKPFRSQCRAGNVYLYRTGNPDQDAWIEPFIAELCAFPTGANDDQVDAVSTGYNALAALEMPSVMGAVW